MQLPAIDDTIVAVSSGWQPSPVGIVRLSGPTSFELLGHLGLAPGQRRDGQRPNWSEGRLKLSAHGELPATVFWFHAPRSYTGQDVAEIHTVGCLPLLRELSSKLITLGARRALPGEFTARAFINGRLAAPQVAAVLALMQSEHQAGLRQVARLARQTPQDSIAGLTDRIAALLALIEAGIDFADDEDICPIQPYEVVARLDDMLATLDRASHMRSDRRGGRPHVALVGLPNAGKSTLFNALVGSERAMVSPVLGTTRDVISAEADLHGRPVVLQDCAGLGASVDELELAAHLAAERTAEQADLVLWIHAADSPWESRETFASRQLPSERQILVITKCDLPAHARSSPPPHQPFAAQVAVSALTRHRLDELRMMIAVHLDKLRAASPIEETAANWPSAADALRRARELAASPAPALPSPELVALELRHALDLITEGGANRVDEDILGRIFTQFCVGK